MNDKYINELKNEIFGVKFSAVCPQQYAMSVRIQYMKNPLKWFESILPKEKAIELKEKTQGDFSKIWHVHCSCCFKNIDKNTTEKCYVSEDDRIWLCSDCYNNIVDKKNAID